MEPGPPRTNDFSPAAVRRAVLKESITHPATLYPGVLAVLGALAGTLFGSPVFIMAGMGAALAAGCGFTVNFFFRAETLASKYFEGLSGKITAAEESRLDELFQELKNSELIPGAENPAARAAEQFVRVRQKYGSLHELLEQKLGSGEVSVGNIWAAGEQVYLGVLDNLRDAATIFRNISEIDIARTEVRLGELSRRAESSRVEAREKETLKKRMKLIDDQLGHVNELLARNEEAITQLEDAAAAIAALDSDDNLASVDPSISVGRLRELASSLRKQESGPRG